MNKINLILSNQFRFKWKFLFAIALLLLTLNISAQQYNVTGTAFAMSTPGCYTLTTTTSQSGAVWNIYTIDLTQPFDITLTLNFGSLPFSSGADGISFVLQPVSSGVFGPGGGVGFEGITPSLGVVMDTYVNSQYYDPNYDHISINKMGDVTHTEYTPATTCPPTGSVLLAAVNELTSYCNTTGWPASLANPYAITDGLGHLFRFSWNPTTMTVNAYFGNSTVLPTTPTISYTGDIINNIFSGNPNVYWGVSGSTGGSWNLQTVCITTVANFVADTIVCYGTPITFFDNSISGLTINSWSWDFGDGGTSIQQNPIHTYDVPGTYLVKLSIVNSGGFSSVMTHNIIVNPKPDIVATSDSICVGDTATLHASGGTSYYWNSNQVDSVIHVSPPVTSTYIVTGENIYHCTSKDTATVTLFTLPVITVANDTICKGDTAILTANGGTSYEWTTPYASFDNYIKVSPNVTTQYTVIGTLNTHGCKNTAVGTVEFYPAPSISFSTDKIKGCEPVTVTFTNETDPATSTYIWDFGDGSPTETTASPVHTYNSTGSPFTVTLNATSDKGCKDSYVAIGLIKVFPQPHAEFTWNPLTGVLSNPIINFYDASTPYNPLFTNIWDFGDGSAFDFSKNPTHIFLTADVFNVIMIVTTDSTYGNCSDTVRHAITVIADSLIFPNIITPNGDNFNDNFVIKGLEKGAYPSNRLVIYNRWGKKVYDANNYQNGAFDGEGLPDGVYYYIFTGKSVMKELKHQSSLEILR
ncbi:MAG: PKD domain-containing protein [Bacteroidota bacterium]